MGLGVGRGFEVVGLAFDLVRWEREGGMWVGKMAEGRGEDGAAMWSNGKGWVRGQERMASKTGKNRKREIKKRTGASVPPARLWLAIFLSPLSVWR